MTTADIITSYTAAGTDQICLIFLGNTYDRSIVVDGEEASLLVFDIWEQVCYKRLSILPCKKIVF